MGKYVIIYPGGVRLVGDARRIVDELKSVLSGVEEGRVLVVEVGRVLLEADAGLLRELLGAAPAQRAAAPAGVNRICAVFDQMYKGFADIIAREISDDRLVLHEVVGRGLEKPLRVGSRLYRQPARDDYDILRLLRRLSRECRVVFFTGDKKLASQASLIDNVEVQYMPPGEFTGKEAALDAMIKLLRKAMSGAEGE